jgi:hypothetical protein
VSTALTTNSRYTSLRSWYFKPHYFQSRAWKALRDYYRFCFASSTPEHHNATISRWAANDARKPWLSTTTRERYYKEFSYRRKLRSIGEGRAVSAPDAIQCHMCSAHTRIRGEVTEQTLEEAGWYLSARETLCPKHNDKE